MSKKSFRLSTVFGSLVVQTICVAIILDCQYLFIFLDSLSGYSACSSISLVYLVLESRKFFGCEEFVWTCWCLYDCLDSPSGYRDYQPMCSVYLAVWIICIGVQKFCM